MKPVHTPHDSAVTHVTGESQFIDDVPIMRGELIVGVFTSSIGKGKLKSLETATARTLPGVVTILTAKDLVTNSWGPIVSDQPILVDTDIEYVGEPIAVVAADSLKHVQAALKEIKAEYETDTAIYEVKTAIEKKYFLHEAQSIVSGDVATQFQNSDHILSGEFTSGGQDHFYLESQAAIAYPQEQGRLEILASSQHPTEVQHVVAKALGLKYSDVVCKVQRMGGAFGGKESQSSHIAALAALVAFKTGRAARLVLNKDDDMQMTGKRHGYFSKYKVGFSKEGKIQALSAEYYADGGAYIDLSPAILQRTLLHADNAYFLPAVDLRGRICKTNVAPNTAFRGFGGPQGAAVIENIIEEIADHLKLDPLVVRKINCYGKTAVNNVTHYGQVVDNNFLPDLLQQLEANCSYQKRLKKIISTNKTHPEWLGGLSLTPTKFGISFTSRFLNQGSALVNVHLDGTIQVSTGATEMGQGVNAKIAQIVAEAFGVASSDVRMMITSTEKNHNTSATAASSGSDINGSAALLACDKIKQRISNIAAQLIIGRQTTADKELQLDSEFEGYEFEFTDGWVISKNHIKKKFELKTLLSELYMNRISLGEQAFYKTPGIDFDKAKGRGTPFLYFTSGAAATEVKVNRWTGEVKVIQTDILMDLGRPIIEGIDKGQVAGAFVQGMGWVTTENLFYKEGVLQSHSPTTYKIPSIQDTPRVFNIDLIDNGSNIKNVRASKAVGEPPFHLALSVWTAVKSALYSYKKSDQGYHTLPATNETIVKYLG